MLPHVFDLFVQADRSLERAQGGLGIGLTLVRRLVELHDGSVTARSDGPGKGSEFVVRLPRAAAGVDEAPAPARLRRRAADTMPARRILVVDDNKDAVDSLALLLSIRRADRRHGARRARRAHAVRTVRPDVVVLDLGLPGINGYEVARRIRDVDHGRRRDAGGAHRLGPGRGSSALDRRRLRLPPGQARRLRGLEDAACRVAARLVTRCRQPICRLPVPIDLTWEASGEPSRALLRPWGHRPPCPSSSSGGAGARRQTFNGLTTGVGDLFRLSRAKSRSISPENFTGAKGQGGRATTGTGANAARDLGQGWKISPSVKIAPKQVFTLAEIAGPGAIQHIWMTPTGHWRFSILRVYWDGETTPSIEVPVGDFFASGWGRYGQINSLAVAVNPGSAFNCYWVMPFRKSCRITMENIADQEMTLYYQIDYSLTEVADDAAYLHAQFRRTNPLPYKQDYTIVDGVKGEGQYVGTHMSWGVNNTGWWGEGEIKFFLDGDTDYPTICGTGTEDYFCGSYNFENQATKQYQEFSTPYSGCRW